MTLLLHRWGEGVNLSEDEIEQGFADFFSEELSDEQIQGLLVSVSKRPVDADLLTGAARAFLRRGIKVELHGLDAIDTAGTGGDRSGSFNFSTAAALLAAACGVPVAKHGNRSISSRSGSADLLEALGIPIELGPVEVAQAVRDHGFGFMLAPRYYGATRRVQEARRRYGGVTVFNFLGPLLNPARVKRQVVGVFDPTLRVVMAEAVYRLGTEKSWVLWGEGGIDEVSLAGKTWVSEVTSQGITERVFEPEQVALRKCELKFLRGGEGPFNAKLLRGIFDKSFFGPLVNGVLINAGAALVVSGRVSDLREGVSLARVTLDEGRASRFLQELTASSAALFSEEV